MTRTFSRYYLIDVDTEDFQCGKCQGVFPYFIQPFPKVEDYIVCPYCGFYNPVDDGIQELQEEETQENLSNPGDTEES